MGPVIGIIHQTSVRLLIETDKNTLVTLNTFLSDKELPENHFVKDEVWVNF